jgi:ABC-2 type transport system ATP-binding protein
MQAIEAHGLTKTYPGGVRAVTDIDFHVTAGEAFGLLGPNGAGKSTTVGMLTTTVRPTAGRALVGGYDVARQPRLARSVSSVVFQEAVVDRTLSGRENLELHAHLWGVRSTHRIPELASQLGLSDLLDRPVGGYSGGERRRLEIARALVSEPAVLFLDEPTVGLDPRIRHELLDVIAGLRARSDLTILITTHYLEEAERLCDRVGIVHSGVLVAVDSPRTLRERLGAEILEFRSGDNAQATLARLRQRGLAGEDAFAVGASVTVPLHDRSVTDVLAALDDARVPVSEVATRAPTLDDVYLHYTGGLAEAA